jgi:hypothetical protein
MAQPQREPAPPDPLRVLTLVRELEQEYGAQQLGQVMQTLLALSFRSAGWTVIKNAVGVPDLQVFEPAKPRGYAIEAKTGDLSITLSKRDLDGVRSTNRTPVVAAFFLSDPIPRWRLIDANSLRPSTYRRYEIESKPMVDVGFDVTVTFSTILVTNFRVAVEGPGALARLLGG